MYLKQPFYGFKSVVVDEWTFSFFLPWDLIFLESKLGKEQKVNSNR